MNKDYENKDFGEMLLNEGFTTFSIEELDKESILADEIFQHLFSITNALERTKLLVRLQQKAKELGVLRNFDRLQKAFQTDFVQQKKQKGSNIISFTNSPLENLKCGKWLATDEGVTRIELNNFEPVNIIACPHPILPVERLINVDNDIEKVKLAFYKDNKWQNVIVEMNTISSKSKIVQLANRGISVNENNAKELITYLSDVINLNTQEIPVSKGIGRLGWKNEMFSPYTKELKYDGDISFRSAFESVKEKGDFEEWKKELLEIRKNKVAHLVIAASFASPLLEIVGSLPFVVHLWGGSGSGKTVALMVAMSIWGNPEFGKLVRTLYSTQVALARYASFVHNIPFAGDELQTIKNKWENYDKLIMYLTEGVDKGRGNIVGGVEEQKEWNCSFLFTGEEPITKDNSGSGVKNRVIEIEAIGTIIQDGNKVSNLVRNNYGFAGKLFIENLPSKDEIQKRYKEIQQEIKDKFATTGKQAMAMASILIADEISTDLIFKDEKLSLEDISAHVASQKEISRAERDYEATIDWININKSKFTNTIASNEIWGQLKDGYCLVIRSKLKEFLNSIGGNFDAIKREWAEKGKLQRDSNGKYSVATDMYGNKGRYYKIITNIIDKNKSDLW